MLLIIPAYNEAGIILNVIDDIKLHCNNVDYIVINDCSTDNTLEVLRENHIKYIDLPFNLGIGGAVQTGYKYAYMNNYDVAVQFDGDGQHMAEHVCDILKPLTDGQADIAIGSRFINKEGFQSSLLRRLGIKIISELVYKLSGIKVIDITSGFRAVNKKMMSVYAHNYVQDYPEPEAVVIAGKYGAKVKEVAVKMRERQFGVSSITPLGSIYYMIKVSISLIFARISIV